MCAMAAHVQMPVRKKSKSVPLLFLCRQPGGAQILTSRAGPAAVQAAGATQKSRAKVQVQVRIVLGTEVAQVLYIPLLK